VLQNGCSSASLKRLSLSVGAEHRSCRLWLVPMLISRQRAPADCRQQESLCQALKVALAVLGNVERARLQDLHRPGTTSQSRRYPCALSAAAAAATGRARAPLHVPLRGAGPVEWLKAQRLRHCWTRARPCCAVAYGAEEVCTRRQ